MTVSACESPTIPTIPRSGWKHHPNYPSQLLLLGSHENFRDYSAGLVTELSDPGPGARSLVTIERQFFAWQSAMQSHERYEELKLYPYLVHRYGVDLSPLEAGHEELDRGRVRMRAAFDEGERQLVAGAMTSFDRDLRRHLDLEEECVIPLLLELTAEEFFQLTHRSISQLLNTPVDCACS